MEAILVVCEQDVHILRHVGNQDTPVNKNQPQKKMEATIYDACAVHTNKEKKI